MGAYGHTPLLWTPVFTGVTAFVDDINTESNRKPAKKEDYA